MIRHGLWAILLMPPFAFGAENGSTGPLHPPVPLLDRTGASVASSGLPISTMRSCAGCHDTQYIATHSYHVTAGVDEDSASSASTAMRRAWDENAGKLGRWNPLQYRYLTSPGDGRLDLGLAEWIQRWGQRHVGGGPAVVGHGVSPLDGASAPDADVLPDPDRQVLDPTTREPEDWDWSVSGTVEMNCFLCHLRKPDNRARIEELSAGRFDWANTATLAETGIVQREGAAWQYRAEAFAPDGTVSSTELGIVAPSSEHCGQCHGQVHFGATPLRLNLSLASRSTVTRGQVFSPQLMFDSAINLSHKQQKRRPWDVHAAAMLECQNCHYSLNDPKSYASSRRGRPTHLRYEPRRLSIADFLRRPSHQLAQGHTEQGRLARHLDGTMRGCEDCHDANKVHDWLPYRAQHFARLACEACHIPETGAPAIQMIDWTMISEGGEPRIQWRGIADPPTDPTSRITGFRPVLLSKQQLDGSPKLSPYNLIGAWYWVEGTGAASRPVRLADLEVALVDDGCYRPEVLVAFDADGDGQLNNRERIVDNSEKKQVIQQRLVAVGVPDARIEADLEAFGLHHGVGPSRTAIRDCTECHASQSRLAQRFPVASYAVADVMPQLISDGVVAFNGEVVVAADGNVFFQPSTHAADLYVLGHDQWPWVQLLGSLSVVAVLFGVLIHTGMRIRTRRRGVSNEAER